MQRGGHGGDLHDSQYSGAAMHVVQGISEKPVKQSNSAMYNRNGSMTIIERVNRSIALCLVTVSFYMHKILIK